MLPAGRLKRGGARARLALALLAAGAARAGDPALDHAAPRAPPAGPEVTLQAGDRLLVLAPHPDDEVLGGGGLLQAAVAQRLPVRVVFLTYGDNNEWSFLLYRKHPVLLPGAVRAMGRVRHDEALAADAGLGLPREQLVFLGYPDFGTLDIWSQHWGARPPLHSLLTRAAAVPYADAYRPGAPYKGEEILRDLTQLLREFRPTRVCVSHPADQNGDHRALYLFTRVALWDLAAELQPELLPYLIHYAHWPRPRGRQPALALDPPPPLADQLAWRRWPLSPAQEGVKEQALRQHASQMESAAGYLLSFVRRNELFGDFPALRPTAESAAVYAARRRARTGEDNEPAEELIQQEREVFVGLDWHYVYRDGDRLVFAVELSRPLANAVQATFSACGYRHDRPFAALPKIRVVIGELDHRVYDQDQRLPARAVEVRRHLKTISVRIPLALLGAPERVLCSARTYLADVPLDWAAWRALDLR